MRCNMERRVSAWRVPRIRVWKSATRRGVPKRNPTFVCDELQISLSGILSFDNIQKASLREGINICSRRKGDRKPACVVGDVVLARS